MKRGLSVLLAMLLLVLSVGPVMAAPAEGDIAAIQSLEQEAVGYPSLAEALAALKGEDWSGDSEIVLTLLENVRLTETLTLDTDMTYIIDMNEKAVLETEEFTGDTLVAVAAGTLTLRNGTLTGDGITALTVAADVDLTLEDMLVNGLGEIGKGIVTDGAAVAILSGVYTATLEALTLADDTADSAVIITTGTFESATEDTAAIAEKTQDSITFTQGFVPTPAQWQEARRVTVKAEEITPEEPEAHYANPFTDASENDWFYGDVLFVAENGLMNGMTADTFGPGLSMTRGMLVTVLGRIAGIDVTEFAQCDFEDVENEKYYAPYIQWASSNGIVQGVGESRFAPDGNITREQIAAILYRYARMMELQLDDSAETEAFADEDDISEYAAEAVLAMQKAGVISGRAGGEGMAFDPQGDARRSEVAAMLHRFVTAITDEAPEGAETSETEETPEETQAPEENGDETQTNE